MNKKHLIVKSEPLQDGYECECDKQPIVIVEDWKEWYKKSKVNYHFEVYEILDNGEIKLIKEWEEAINSGMVLIVIDDWTKAKPKVLKKFPKLNEKSEIPKYVKSFFKKEGVEFNKEKLEDEKCNSFNKENDDYYCYCYYEDNNYWLDF